MPDDWKPELSSWKARFPELKWWLDTERAKRERIPKGSLERRRGPVPRVDTITGQEWLIDPTPAAGRIHVWKPRKMPGAGRSWKFMKLEMKYTPVQYELIAWSLHYLMNEGWTPHECCTMLSNFWKLEVGQTPLTSKVINGWYMLHRRLKKKGLLWP
jgi:hypothetical protein